MGSHDEEAIGQHVRALRASRGISLADPLGDLASPSIDLQALLKDVLDRVVKVMDVDTAAVLLTDASGRELVARAALGIEEEVRQGVRVRIGEGFAGRVAAAKQPLFLDLVDETTVSNSILWRRGIRTMLGVPLMSGVDVLGVLHVGSLSARPFGERDAAVLGLIADRVGAEVQMRLLGADRRGR